MKCLCPAPALVFHPAIAHTPQEGKHASREPHRLEATTVHVYAEQWRQAVKEEVLWRVMLCGEHSLCHVLKAYMAYYHEEHPIRGRAM